ncbi:MAG TPA: dTDP-4-dehydrorhamnose 3,5-epimerase [Puia sp.]|nr:dTDP-4-dehydrorhamnose 3,5-epimerase [Puia sp.]
MMRFIPTPLAGAYIVEPEAFSDNRGWFMRVYCKNEFAAIGHTKEWVQMNHSFNNTRGTIRGLHFQPPPYEEIKLVRCIAGAVFDVIVDLRKDSPTLLQSYGVELSAANRKMIYIPGGFAHGFQVLKDNSELLYLHSGFYTPGAEGGMRYDDPVLDIKWPLPVSVISDRDAQHSLLTENFKGI